MTPAPAAPAATPDRCARARRGSWADRPAPTPPARPTGPCCIRSRRMATAPGASPSAGTLPARADLVAASEQIWRFRRRGLRRRAGESDNRTDAGESPGEWAITDESPGGFGLRYLGRSASALRVADVCALRPRERSWCIFAWCAGGQPRRARIRHRRRGARRARREHHAQSACRTIGEPRTSVDVILLPRACACAPGRDSRPVGAVRAIPSSWFTGMAANGASSPPTRWSISTPASSFPCACCRTRHPAEQAQRGRPACRTAPAAPTPDAAVVRREMQSGLLALR